MLVSIVIPVYNRKDSIKKCLESVLSQDFKESYEVIVVDDASTDNTRLALSEFRDPRITVIYNEKKQGPSYSRNKGIQQSQGQYVAFIDSDCIADKNWIKKIIRPFDLNASTMITSGKTIDTPSTTYWEIVNGGQNFITLKDGYVGESHSCNMAARRSFIRENLFDENLHFSEDLDLCLRCLNKDLKINYTSQAIIMHSHRSTFNTSVRSHFRWGTYNAFVRLKWKAFPFLNYGTFILLGSIASLLGGFIKLATFFILAYLVLIFYLAIRPRDTGPIKLIISYPARVIFSLIDCLGNFRGLLLFILWQWKGK